MRLFAGYNDKYVCEDLEAVCGEDRREERKRKRYNRPLRCMLPHNCHSLLFSIISRNFHLAFVWNITIAIRTALEVEDGNEGYSDIKTKTIKVNWSADEVEGKTIRKEKIQYWFEELSVPGRNSPLQMICPRGSQKSFRLEEDLLSVLQVKEFMAMVLSTYNTSTPDWIIKLPLHLDNWKTLSRARLGEWKMRKPNRIEIVLLENLPRVQVMI